MFKIKTRAEENPFSSIFDHVILKHEAAAVHRAAKTAG